MGIHSTEVLASEAERIRSIQSNLVSVPRFSDFFSIYQTCKFQLSEIDDSRESRSMILNSIIESAIREVSASYIQNLSSDQLMKIKEDFGSNKQFIASQMIPGRGHGGGADYISQLERFPGLNELVTQTANKIKQEHLSLIQLATGLDIDSRAVQLVNDRDSELVNDRDSEFTASVTELVLEGLRWTDPPLLDKMGGKYTAKPQ
jgi:magnesium chelatase subunit I